jgi:hypothetical protein
LFIYIKHHRHPSIFFMWVIMFYTYYFLLFLLILESDLFSCCNIWIDGWFFFPFFISF